MIDDSELVENYLLGEEKAFEAIVDRYIKPVYGFVFRFTGHVEESNDLVQDIFLKVWKNLKKFDPEKSFKAWIFTIARNTVFDWLRKQKSIVFSDLDTEDQSFAETIADTEPIADEVLFQKENQDALNRAIGELSEETRELVLLRLGEELTFDEIAEIVGKPMNTVKSKYRRALLELKRKLS